MGRILKHNYLIEARRVGPEKCYNRIQVSAVTALSEESMSKQ